jgi:hypothetical protein
MVSYTAAEMNRNITDGTINPHDVRQNFSYQNQLYDQPAIDSCLNTNAAPHDELLGNDTHPFDETNFDIDHSPNESEDDIGEPMYDADNDDDDDSLFVPSIHSQGIWMMKCHSVMTINTSMKTI